MAFTSGSHVQSGEVFVNSAWSRVAFPTSFSSTPLVFAQITTRRGSDYVYVDIKNVTTTGFTIRAEEDRGPLGVWQDGVHLFESVSYIAIDPSTVVAGQGIEVKSMPIKQTRASSSTILTFSETFSAPPVLFSQIQTENNGQTARIDIISVSSGSAVLRVEEDRGSGVRGWDGAHTTETVAYLAIDSTLDFSSLGLMVGTEDVDSNWTSVCFDASCSDVFDSTPSFLAQSQTNFETDTAQVQVQSLTVGGFSGRQVELTGAGWNGIHAVESVGWLAFGTIASYDPAEHPIALVETSSSGVSYIESALIADGYPVTRFTNSDLIAGASLAGFDTLVMPGGTDPVYDAMDTTLQSVVQNFVSSGGGYVGICGGAIAGSDTVTLLDYYGVSLDMLGIGTGVNSIYNTGWTSYVGSSSPWLELEVSTDHAIFDGLYSAGDIATLRYYGGPVFSVLSSATVLATYYQNFDSSYSVIGSPAIVESSYGSGKVILFALHPEYDSSTQPLLLNAVQYVNE